MDRDNLYPHGEDGLTLDPSCAKTIHLPPSFKYKKEESQSPWPDGFWDHFNKATDQYSHGRYGKAKEEFLAARSLKDDYESLNSYLLRTYRKLYKAAVEKSRWNDAYIHLVELFSILPTQISDTDRKQYNRVIEGIKKADAGFSGRPIELERIKKDSKVSKLTVDVEEVVPGQIRVLDDSWVRPKGEKPIQWSKITYTKTGLVCWKHIYDKERGGYSSCRMRVYSHGGEVVLENELSADFYRLKVSAFGDRFIGFSEELKLSLWSLDGNMLAERTVQREAQNSKDHIRCVDLSADGKHSLFTSSTRAYWMDEKLRSLRTWIMPPPEGYEVGKREPDPLSEEVKRAMAVLELDGNPTPEELKAQYRHLMFRYHPDHHPGDAAAEERTKQIIGAYKTVSPEDVRSALAGLEGEEYYYRVLNEMTFGDPNLGIPFTVRVSTSGPGDWIYASHVTENADRIYLGCYSGVIYCVDASGRVQKVYITDDTIRGIEEREPFLYLQTNYGLYVLRDDTLVNHIEIGIGDLETFADWGIVVKRNSALFLYRHDGALLGTARFSQEPREVVPTGQGLTVYTAKYRTTLLVSQA